jgi:hypothetical protein
VGLSWLRGHSAQPQFTLTSRLSTDTCYGCDTLNRRRTFSSCRREPQAPDQWPAHHVRDPRPNVERALRRGRNYLTVRLGARPKCVFDAFVVPLSREQAVLHVHHWRNLLLSMCVPPVSWEFVRSHTHNPPAQAPAYNQAPNQGPGTCARPRPPLVVLCGVVIIWPLVIPNDDG